VLNEEVVTVRQYVFGGSLRATGYLPPADQPVRDLLWVHRSLLHLIGGFPVHRRRYSSMSRICVARSRWQRRLSRQVDRLSRFRQESSGERGHPAEPESQRGRQADADPIEARPPTQHEEATAVAALKVTQRQLRSPANRRTNTTQARINASSEMPGAMLCTVACQL
jgi:hypothetical protein